MVKNAATTQWEEQLRADIALIRAANIRPRVIPQRLKGILDNKDAGVWRRFRVPVSGESAYLVERDGYHIVIQFSRHGTPENVKEIYNTLFELRNKLQVVTGMKTTKSNITIVVSLRP